jgi:lysophospholipase L1-like esterase
MKEVCDKYNVLNLNLGILGDEDFEDGLHPNAKGHENIFSVVRSFLVEQNWI